MSDSIAQKVADFQVQRILNRTGMSDVQVVTFEKDTQADQDRIVVDAERLEESPEGAGIFRVRVTNTVKVKTETAATVDAWLAEIDATQTSWTPGAPTAEYIAALAALSDFVVANDQDSARETSDKTRQMSRTFDVLAS
jgi:hypothetical protein